MPQLRAIHPCGLEVGLPLTDLLKKAKHAKINLIELLKAATTVSRGGQYCTKVLKVKEGTRNTGYILTMNNGIEIFARLPHLDTSPLFYAVASEVALRKFLQDVPGIPITRLLAWSSDPYNLVGSEYILEERALGERLDKFWVQPQFSMECRASIIGEILEMEKLLSTMTFSRIGNLYLREDIPFSHEAEVNYLSDPKSPLRSHTKHKNFTQGPLVDSRLWSGRKAHMNTNKGPYSSTQEYILALAKNEIRYLNEHTSESSKRMVQLLGYYQQLLPAMDFHEHFHLTSSNVDITSPTLRHPSLDLNKVFIDPLSKKITHIVGWQSYNILPTFLHCDIPPMFKHTGLFWSGEFQFDLACCAPRKPANFDSMSSDMKGEVLWHILREIIHKYYLAASAEFTPAYFAAYSIVGDPIANVRTRPLLIVGRGDNDTFDMELSLRNIVRQWDRLCLGDGPCPVQFTKREDEEFSEELDNSVAR